MAVRAALARRTRSGGASTSSAAAGRRTAPATPPSSPRRPAAARDRDPLDSGGSVRSRSAKGSPELPPSGPRRSPHIAGSPIAAVMRGARRKAAVARAETVLQPDPSKPRPQCIWCWMERPDHELKSCPEKPSPNMSDFKQARAVRLRSAGLQRSAGQPSGRMKEEQQAHEATYSTVHKQRTRALVVDAKAALAAHLEAAAQPLTPNGPFGQFTTYQLLALEFASQMDQLLPAAVLAKGPVSINSSCMQRFTARLTKPVGEAAAEQAAFKSIADVRAKGEPTISDFALTRSQLQSSPERAAQLEQMLSYANGQLRIASPFCAALKQLPCSASLLEHHRVVSIASRPRMGAPPKAEREAASGSLTIAVSWSKAVSENMKLRDGRTN